MMVLVEIGVEPRPFASGPKGLDNSQVDEQPEGPVDRIQRHRRHAVPDPAVDRLGVGVVAGLRDFPEDLQALMGQLGSRFAASPLEVRHARRNILIVASHFSRPNRNEFRNRSLS